MGKEVDLEALAAQYIWKHLKKLNMGAPILRRWRSSGLMNATRRSVLFTIHFVSVIEKAHEGIDLPIAILTEDCILRYLVGSGTVDLKEHRPPRGGDYIG